MNRKLTIPLPKNFSFRHTVGGHGWYDLAPFDYDERGGSLGYTLAPDDRSGSGAIAMTAKVKSRRLMIEHAGSAADDERVAAAAAHILRLDERLDDFYRVVRENERLSWTAAAGAGRLLRSETVWEDLIKTLCTTNCSWSLTRKMVGNLVEKLGDTAAADGRKAFPTPEAMASVGPEFYRDEIKAGYRSPYFVELAESVASGRLDPQSWLTSGLPTAELRRELKKVKGVGDYAADNLLKLLGRYDGLALDSWLRAQFYKRHNRGKQCPDKKIEKFYSKFGDWKGLAIWCDMTEDWFKEDEGR